jgi:hypothetical protein
MRCRSEGYDEPGSAGILRDATGKQQCKAATISMVLTFIYLVFLKRI